MGELYVTYVGMPGGEEVKRASRNLYGMTKLYGSLSEGMLRLFLWDSRGEC